MKTRFSLLLAALCSLVGLVPLHAQSTAFTYQGRLTTNSAPATGRFDFEFSVFSAASDGLPISGPLALPGVGVTNGVFTVPLDFGTGVFNGSPRWLGITVRPAGGGIITPLNPRQPFTPTPYAVTALNALTASSVPGVNGHSLNAQDGSPANAVFVDNDGKVGAGTLSPAAMAFPPRLESGGGTTFNAGLDFYPAGIGKGYVGVPDSLAVVAAGEMLVYGGPNVKTTLWSGGARSLTATTSGNVGIGTDTPVAKLEVRGDIRMGASGQLRATSSEENLRIVRGVVSAAGNVLQGSGFTVSHPAAGEYTVTFNSPFTAPPVVTATADFSSNLGQRAIMTQRVTANAASLVVFRTEETGTLRDEVFNFIAIGPR